MFTRAFSLKDKAKDMVPGVKGEGGSQDEGDVALLTILFLLNPSLAYVLDGLWIIVRVS